MSGRGRTRGVGILKSLGYSSSEILGMILGESLLIGVIGGVVGCLAAEGLCLTLASAARHAPALISFVSLTMTPLTILLTPAAGAACAAVCVCIPRPYTPRHTSHNDNATTEL